MLAAIIAQGATFACTPSRVWDGDGPIWSVEGPKIRLAGIAAREIDETCRRGTPAPSAAAWMLATISSDCWAAPRGTARTGHVLVRGPALRCQSERSGKGERTAAWCVTSTGVDLEYPL